MDDEAIKGVTSVCGSEFDADHKYDVRHLIFSKALTKLVIKLFTTIIGFCWLLSAFAICASNIMDNIIETIEVTCSMPATTTTSPA